ncbi:AKAP7 2'5' RNA ligase-like domain-containing protein [Gongronella butleri]|nr:AKAP7 2'5' RNA ligase-like domain-containing protein [Gongronella butleri]
MYHGILIGKSGSTLKRLKLETGTRIDVMNGKDEVMIKGTQDKVDRAIQVIDAHLQQAIAKANLTHFVALPTQASFATRKLLDFHKEVAAYKADGINTKMLIPPQKLHITLGVCKLLSQTDLEKAILTMKQDLPPLIHSIMQNESVIAIRLKKLAIMEEDPKKASILYIEAQDETKTQVLTRLCEGIRNKLMDQGIILDEGRPLKIHITLLKTRGSGMDSDRPTFDARKLLKAHGDLDLGLVHIDKLHLMKLGPLNADGTYISDGSITL